MYWVTENAEDPFHLGYNLTSNSATAGRDGDQIGADWELNNLTDVINSIIANENALSVYPNPTTSFLNIKHDDEPLQIQIFDMSGKLVYQVMDNYYPIKELNVSNLNKGLYIIAITNKNNHKRVAKFVKQ